MRNLSMIGVGKCTPSKYTAGISSNNLSILSYMHEHDLEKFDDGAYKAGMIGTLEGDDMCPLLLF